MKKIKNFLWNAIASLGIFLVVVALSVEMISYLWKNSPIIYWGKKGYYYIMNRETSEEALEKVKIFILNNSTLKEMREIAEDPNLHIEIKLKKIEYEINKFKEEIKNSDIINKEYKEILIEDKYIKDGIILQLKYMMRGLSYYTNGLYELNEDFIVNAQSEIDKVTILSEKQKNKISKFYSKTKEIIKKARLGILQDEEIEEYINMGIKLETMFSDIQ